MEISQIASITREKYNEISKKYVKRLIKVITYGFNYPTQLRYPKLDVSAIPIVGYSDASFASNDDLSSQVGLIIFLVDTDENSAPIALKS